MKNNIEFNKNINKKININNNLIILTNNIIILIIIVVFLKIIFNLLFKI